MNRSVVAPVECGAGQAELRTWAAAHGYVVSVGVPPAPDQPERWVWLPDSRRALTELRVDLGQVLILSAEDTRLSASEWAAALGDLSPERQHATFLAFEGWPGALPVARRVQGDPLEAHRQPATLALLAAFLPPRPLRTAAERLAVSVLITPAVAERLEVTSDTLDALIDGGWLWPAPGGWTFPALLRRTLAPAPAPARVRDAAETLHHSGDDLAALETLAGGQLWAEYLTLLAQVARSAQGETSLRRHWEALPERWRHEPAGLYVAGLLARAAGDLGAAEALYSRALPALSGPLQAQASNARGVARALRGAVDEALADFERAASQGSSAGEANHNRATLLVQLGRHAEAESSLASAVAAFRAAGDRRRESHSLETLGSLQFGRGLLREALAAYRKALALFLPEFEREAALVHLNLAECLAPLGELPRAHLHLQEAAILLGSSPDAPAAGWLHRARATAALYAASPAETLAHLERIHPDTDDRSLQMEAALLRARAHRELGQPEAARAALVAARPLGLRADLEEALLGGAPLDPLIEAARRDEARLELVAGLLERSAAPDLTEALELIRSHGYLALLGSRSAAPLVSMAQDAETRALFPLRVQTVGPLRFTHAGRTVQLPDFPTRKSAALLVALALADHPQPREVLAERFWPGAKNPLASLQTAVYHLRSVFGVTLVGSERGQLHLLFPVHSDVSALRRALSSTDREELAALLRPMTAPLSVLSELPSELEEERQQAERLLHDALRLHAEAQPHGEVRRRDALRVLIAADPLDLDARADLIRWHEQRGEHELAAQERQLHTQAARSLES